MDKEVVIGKLTEIGPKINDTDSDKPVWMEWSLTYWWKTTNPVHGQDGNTPKPVFRLDSQGNIFYDKGES